MRTQKLPELQTLLRRSRGKKQTLDEQRSMLKVLSEQFGIPLGKTRLRKREPTRQSA